MIDIHAHIMPGIDDGAATMEEAIQMLKIAAENGVYAIVATPHCNMEGLYENYFDDDYYALYKRLEAEAAKENIPVQIIPGMEVYASENVLELLQQGKIITIGGSRYLLIEFGMQKDLALINFLIDELLAMGYIPVIAHPERYPYVQKTPQLAANWLKQGCLLQLDAGSVLGSFGRQAKNTAIYMLERNMVSFVASDAHGERHRTADLSTVFDFLCSNFSLDLAIMLLEDNPAKVIYNHDFSEMKLMLG